MNRISVGIPTYCGAAHVESDILWMCLDAIRVRTCSTIAFDVIVVDDSGKPEHRAKSRVVAERFGARWLAHEENRGVSAGWNTLTRATDTPYMALLNDDFFVSRGWLDALVYFLDENPHAGSVGLYAFFCRLNDVSQLHQNADTTITPCHHASKELKPEYAVEHHGRETPGLCMAAPGCGFAFTREKYNLVGGFDESLGKAFYEEFDFGTSLASKGFPSYALQWPHCYTPMSATFGRSPELLGTGDVFAAPRAKYIAKWGGHTEVTHPQFMSKIPFRSTKWLDPDGKREQVIVDEHGYHP